MLDNVKFVSVNKATVSNASKLRNGSFVFVRVLNNRLLDKSEILFSGIKAWVDTSSLPSKNDFVAKVFFKDGKICLIPQTEENQNSIFEKLQVFESNPNINNIQGSMLSSMLYGLNLPEDALSFKLIQFLQTVNAKIDSKKILLARKIGSCFGEKKDKASRIALLLQDKNIEPTVELVLELLNILENENFQKEKSFNDEKHIIIEESFLDEIYDEKVNFKSKKEGLLTLSNHLFNGCKHWIMLPFIYSVNGNDAKGVIRILLDIMQKKTEKTVVTIDFCKKSFIFELIYNEKKSADNVRFCVNPLPDERCLKVYEKLLRSSFGEDTEVLYDSNLYSAEDLSTVYFLDTEA